MTTEFTQHEEQKLYLEKKSSFWNSVFGKILRWVIYIPAGLILLTIVETTSTFFFFWLFDGNMRTFIVVGIVLGGLSMLLPIVLIIYYFIIILANQIICPEPKRGSIIFSVMYIASGIGHVVATFDSGLVIGLIVIALLVKLALATTATFGIMHVYGES